MSTFLGFSRRANFSRLAAGAVSANPTRKVYFQARLQSLSSNSLKRGLSTRMNVLEAESNLEARASFVPRASIDDSVFDEPIKALNVEETVALDPMSRQIKLEQSIIQEQEKEMRNSWEGLRLIGRGTSIKRAQQKIAEWYYPVTEMLELEKHLIETKVLGGDRGIYGPYFILFEPHKLAVLTLEMVMSSVIRCDNAGAPLMKLMLDIGNAIEAEYKISVLKKSKNDSLSWAKKLLSTGNSLKTYVRIKRTLHDDEEWPIELKVKMGSVLLKSVIYACKTSKGENAFDCDLNYNFNTSRRLGVFKMSKSAYEYFQNLIAFIPPSYPPMLMPPSSWDNKAYVGAYCDLKAPLMKHVSRKQREAVRQASMPRVLEGLDYLGSIPWKVNTRMLNLIEQLREKGIVIGELQPKENMPIPSFESFFEDVKKNPGMLRTRYFEPTEAQPEDIMTQAKAQYRSYRGRIEKKNAEMHSLRCDLAIKTSVATDFKDEKFFFPHNVDFRGRAYPVPPNLNHLGSDLCRSMLMFGQGKPLGRDGLRWLKIHIANLCGVNKISMDDRVKWVESQLDDIIDSVNDPLTGRMWWASTENPFQTLAASFELVAAIQSPDPSKFISHVPVHQDGSCNGLQHYASLGRDYSGGQAVNLVDAEVPQDVYTRVLEVVKRKIQEDAEITEEGADSELMARRKKRALRVKDVVNRKVIKQTVMTSVYGVTFIGAKAQIQARLYEAFNIDTALVSNAEEDEIYGLAGYLADITLQSLREVFQNAKKIMDWLAEVSYKVAKEGHGMSWVTPLGLPVVQPYRAQSGYAVKTVLSSVVVAKETEDLPINCAKQKSAFPPNFVHSLDATHMLLTSLRMKESGLHFAAVHDSYWTHAADVEVMRKKLRESFVELYDQPILENLRDSIVSRYPDLDIPPLPSRGTLDLKEVLNSSYFFH